MAPFYVSDDEIEERAGFLDEVARSLFSDGVFPEDRILYKGARVPILTRAYYLLNEAYKAWRIEPGHRTELFKVAALQSMAIATFQPVVPIEAANALTIVEARANEIFALACACTTLGVTINPDDEGTRDFWRRLLDILNGANSQTLEPYRVDVNLQIRRPMDAYKLTIHNDDKPTINTLVSIFELIGGKIKLEPPLT